MSCNLTTVTMECSRIGETYPAETITLGFDITNCVLSRELRNAQTNAVVKSWSSNNVGEITINDAASGVYTIPKWTVTIPATNYIGEDKIVYANGDVQDMWNLTLKVDA